MASRIVKLKIDDEKIAQAIAGYKEYIERVKREVYISFEEDEFGAELQARSRNEQWSAWYAIAQDEVIKGKHTHAISTMICQAHEDYLTVEAIHNCIEILGLNLNEVEDYDM